MTIKEYVLKRKQEIKDEVSKMSVAPSLVIVQLNEDEASKAYIRGKLKDANELGVNASLIKLPIETSQEELFQTIDKLNTDPNVDGFIVQMPLPPQINEDKVKERILPSKDVDGFHPMSELNPCTPQGIINYLKSENFQFSGKNAVVLGRSNIVGKPMAKLLLKENCNVTILHSKTSEEDKAFYLGHADLIVVAIGRQGFLDNRFKYKPTAIIVDVGINRDEAGLHGDAIPDLPVSLQTPVPGGVGLITRLALYENLMKIKNKK